MSKYRVPITTGVVCLLLIGIYYLAFGPVSLTDGDKQIITREYQGRYSYVVELKARRNLFRSDRVLVTLKAALAYPQWPEKIQIVYDRRGQTILSAKTINGTATLIYWLISLAALCGLAAFHWIYIRPVLAGHYCPRCRRLGLFPVVLKDTERELYRETMGKDGQLFPLILETEWVCPLCNFREYTVHRPRQQEEDAYLFGRILFTMRDLQATVHPYASEKDLQNTVDSFVARMEAEGITEEEYRQRWEGALASAQERSDKREVE